MNRFAALTLALSLTLSLPCTGRAAVFTGSIDGPNDVDHFKLAHPAGELSVTIAADPQLTAYVGLSQGDRTLAISGPGEAITINVAGGLYDVAVTGVGTGRYTLDVPGGSIVPEPTTFAVLAAVALIACRPQR